VVDNNHLAGGGGLQGQQQLPLLCFWVIKWNAQQDAITTFISGKILTLVPENVKTHHFHSGDAHPTEHPSTYTENLPCWVT